MESKTEKTISFWIFYTGRLAINLCVIYASRLKHYLFSYFCIQNRFIDINLPENFSKLLIKEPKYTNLVIFRCVSTSINQKFPTFFPPSRTHSSTRDSLTIPLLFEDMFTQCLKTCLHHVYRHVYTMVTCMLTPCLHLVYTIFEDMFPQYLTICLKNVSRHV